MENSEGYRKAIELLMRASTPHGFVASPDEKDNYRRIWTRDGVVIGIAALLSEEEQLIKCFHQTLETLFTNQHALGFMPSNVTSTGGVSYGGTAGRADNPSWAVLGLCLYTIKTGDQTLAERFHTQAEKCFHVLDVWEYNGKHLVYVPQSGDWADEYFYHGYVLTDQLLRLWALRLAARVYGREDWQRKAADITSTIQQNYWNRPGEKQLYAGNLKHQLPEAPDDFWLMGFNPGCVYSRFDLLANSLALLLGIGDNEQNTRTTSYMKNLSGIYETILPAFYPAVEDDHSEMHGLKNNFAYAFRNYPHQFHNGGLWPVWNGFAAAALARNGETAFAEIITVQLHEANAAGNWNFNECLEGKTKAPIGVPYCSWSAAGAVIAETSILKNTTSTLMT